MSTHESCTTEFYWGGDTKQHQQRRKKACGACEKHLLPKISASPVKSICFFSQVVTTPVKCGLLGSSLEMQCPRGSIWWCPVLGMPLPSTYQKARVPEGRQLLIISHTVYTDNAATLYKFAKVSPNPSSHIPAKRQHFLRKL